MQPQQSSRIDLVELKAHLVKKVGVERFKKYFYYLNRFLSQKLNKTDFDRSCFRLLGRENLPLHNQLICSILKNACQAKPAAPRPVGPTKTGNHSAPSIWSSNGVLPVSPRKVRSGIRGDRKPRDRDRPSPLGPTGKKADPAGAHHVITDNGEMMTPCNNERERSANVEDGEELEQAKHSSFSTSPLLAPLGIPFCSASVGGSRKVQPVATSSNFFSCYENGGLSDSETLRKRMEQIAALQGIEGVSMECANTLNNMLDLYLKRLVKSCVDLSGSRKPHMHKQQVPGKVTNGIWPTNHLHMQTNSEQRPRCSISLHDFKVAMELNPQQLGEDWPLLLEKICMHSFDD